jgi:DNA mismatch endonuclease (patch repair protein)
MRAVKSQDTAPELVVRRMLHAAGFRYRLHPGDLPGRPDIVFRRKKQAIFVHGCFWHGHPCPRGGRAPKTNSEYWKEKLQRNERRDRKAVESLRLMGWAVLVIWECEMADVERLKQSIMQFVA